MAQIKTGTVTVENGNNVVTGVGTTWLTDGVQAGDGFIIATSTGIDGAGVYYTVGGSVTNTGLQLSSNWAGASGSALAYVIHVDFIAPGYPILQPGDLEVKPIINNAVQKLLNQKADEADLGTAASADLTTSPTDTTAGRVLKVGDGGLLKQLSAELVLSDTENINTTRFGRSQSGTTANPPASGSYNLLSMASSSVTNSLMAIEWSSGEPNVYFKSQLTNYGPWRKAYTNGNILGPVSQSGGVPTGAIIERGSNASGSYVKFADGTLICTRTFTTNGSAGQTISWASPFVDSTYTVVGSSTGSLGAADVTMRTNNKMTNTFDLVSVVNGGHSSAILDITATGRWY